MKKALNECSEPKKYFYLALRLKKLDLIYLIEDQCQDLFQCSIDGFTQKQKSRYWFEFESRHKWILWACNNLIFKITGSQIFSKIFLIPKRAFFLGSI